MQSLDNEGVTSILIARDKEVLFQLLEDESNRKIYRESGRKGSFSFIKAIYQMLSRDLRLLKICLKEKPSILVGSDIAIAHVGWLLRIPSLLLNENDADTIPFVVKYGNPFASKLSMPNGCTTGGFDSKTEFYYGCHELAYLSPKYFKYNESKIPAKLKQKPLAILRLVAHNAHHDVGMAGISDEQAFKIVDFLEKRFEVVISSERKLPNLLQKNILKIDPREIHHFMAGSELFIGDSATMVAEAGVLGVHSIYISDFATRLCYVNRLERFDLCKSFKPNDFDQFYNYLINIDFEVLRDKMKKNQQEMLDQSVDVSQFWKKLIVDMTNTK